MTKNTTALTKERGAGSLVLVLGGIIGLAVLGTKMGLLEPPAPSSIPQVSSNFNLRQDNRFACNTTAMPESVETADISGRFYRGGEVLILSGNVRTDGQWEAYGNGLRYRSLKTTIGNQEMTTTTPTWFNMDRFVVIGKKNGKTLLRIEGYETLYCISELQ